MPYNDLERVYERARGFLLPAETKNFNPPEKFTYPDGSVLLIATHQDGIERIAIDGWKESGKDVFRISKVGIREYPGGVTDMPLWLDSEIRLTGKLARYNATPAFHNWAHSLVLGDNLDILSEATILHTISFDLGDETEMENQALVKLHSTITTSESGLVATWQLPKGEVLPDLLTANQINITSNRDFVTMRDFMFEKERKLWGVAVGEQANSIYNYEFDAIGEHGLNQLRQYATDLMSFAFSISGDRECISMLQPTMQYADQIVEFIIEEMTRE